MSSGPLAAATATLLVLASVAAKQLPDRVPAPQLFATADACMACHNNLSTPDGEDVSIGTAWSATMMANSARDPYWQASVRAEALDYPADRAAIENECATCHAPMYRTQSRVEGRGTDLLSHFPVGVAGGEADDLLAADGVSCTVCHQIGAEGLGTAPTFNGRFAIDTTTPFGERRIYGPHAVDRGRSRIMQSSSAFVPTQGAHIRSSELCATCHTLYTDARGANGEIVGRFPEQVPYLEWKQSSFASGPGARSCQGCHMPAVVDSGRISAVWGAQRAGLARHEFLGGNFFMLAMLNRYRAELGVTASPEALDRAARRTVEHLRSDAARLSLGGVRVADGRLVAEVAVSNLTGHKLPTAYPSRRAWLHVVVRDRAGALVFESGRMEPTGAITGNDNDADAARYEAHHREITSAGEVQIYEAILADAGGRVTTGLLSAVRYLKDNRIPPPGFDKRTAPADVAVHGNAGDDADFGAGSDKVRYAVDVSRSQGPFTIDATLRFQPIAFRWARNLTRHRGPGAPEIDHFSAYYGSMSRASSAVLAHAAATVP